jgi:ATP-dependent Lon protease
VTDIQDEPDTPVDTPIPENGLIILPLRNFVAFPGTIFPLSVGRSSSMAALEQTTRQNRQIGVILQTDPQQDAPDLNGLHRVGCTAEILRYVEVPGGGNHLICRGLARFRLTGLVPDAPFHVGLVQAIAEPVDTRAETEARLLYLRDLAVELLGLMPDAPAGLAENVSEMSDAGHLADLAAAYSDLTTEERQEVLETVEIAARVALVTTRILRRVEVLRISHEIGQRAQEALENRQREIILREQLLTIRHELGENGGGLRAEAAELAKAIDRAGMPKPVKGQVLRELGRYERLPEGAAEAGILRNWLDWMVELPWNLPHEIPVDLADARSILDADHFGLDKVKKRIIEFLAVQRLAPFGKAPILCLAGPPGVGKTSLGKSIARALHRSFVRLSLGGVHDEAEIRGHRRTYIGAMPGMIAQQIRKAGARNCLLMLDEIDKMGAGQGGDPSAALLEVLDPEQNTAFRDNYLGVDFDLSHVVFLTTANTLDDVPGPLRDRMEVISLPGYLAEEKLQIARRYLVPAQMAAAGLKSEQVSLTDAALTAVITGHTREAGVRLLERRIGALMRNAAVGIVEETVQTVTIGPTEVIEILGPARYENEVALRTGLPGVATGLAWTPVGGDILFIEAERTSGKGGLILTGQLGEVMRESAQAALTLLKARAEGLGLDVATFDRLDLHVHVPAGATPKDGPSAGVAIFAALVSLMLGRKLRGDTAMTGEISLRGRVLPVGGIREKAVAAAAAGITRVLLPARNQPDFEDIPESARNALEFVWLESVDDVLAQAMEAEQTAK